MPPITSVFYELEFLILVLASLLAPVSIYFFMLLRRSISPWTVLLLAVALIALAGVDLITLQKLSLAAKASSSTLDDQFFATEISLALYLLPALFAGIGINLASHVLIRHPEQAERRFEQHQHASAESHSPR